jgi:lipopolysaccharide/colanic/teichoic acid biosynthesis glycosyltransferase
MGVAATPRGRMRTTAAIQHRTFTSVGVVRSRAGKRIFDVVVGTVLAVIVTPFVIVSAIWLAATLRAWPFFVQERIGQHGRSIRFLKLRSLPPSTPPYALKSELSTAATTRFGRFLRTNHLDELTQLYLVPLGRLSLVGPRPKMPDAVEPVDPRYAALRVRVPQGCTGLWQIGAHKHLLPSEAPQYDEVYVHRSTMWLDVWILWRTVLVMLHLGGPIEPADIPARALRPVPDSDVIDLRVIDLVALEADEDEKELQSA